MRSSGDKLLTCPLNGTKLGLQKPIILRQIYDSYVTTL